MPTMQMKAWKKPGAPVVGQWLQDQKREYVGDGHGKRYLDHLPVNKMAPPWMSIDRGQRRQGVQILVPQALRWKNLGKELIHRQLKQAGLFVFNFLFSTFKPNPYAFSKHLGTCLQDELG